MKMNPLGRLLIYYHDRGVTELIWPMLEFCGDHGLVYLTPDTALVARPARRDWTLEQLMNLDNKAALTLNPDAWHIFYAAGDLVQMARVAPYRLPWVSFQRNGGRLRHYPFDRLTNGIHAIRPQAPGPEGHRLRN